MGAFGERPSEAQGMGPRAEAGGRRHPRRDDPQEFPAVQGRRRTPLEEAERLEWADDPARVRTILIGELEETLHGAWCYYLQEQAKLDRAREAKEREARRRQLKQKAAQAAVKYRNQHARTSGTVVTGLVDLETGNVYVGQSGTGNRITPTLHPVMYELLGGSGPVAQWPTDVCGEVNVMNEYLHKSNFTSASQIPANSLVFHSETFNSGGTVINKKTGKPTVKTPHWESRGACKNCEKWITRIGAETA